LQLTTEARSRPSVARAERALATRASRSDSSVETTQRSEPSVRTIRVSRRVSTPSIATTPWALSHTGRLEVARRPLARADISRITRASTQGRELSPSSAATP